MSTGRKQRTYKPGDVVGEWTLLRYVPGKQVTATAPRRRPYWSCCCSCGVERDVMAERLIDGTSSSCGHSRQRATTIAEHVRALVKVYGGLNAAARGLKIDAGYLSRLQSGEKHEPSDEVLQKMGVRRVVAYVRTAEPGERLRARESRLVNSVFQLGAL